MRYFWLVVVLTSLLTSGMAFSGKIWQERDGHVIIEVESVDKNVDFDIWEMKTEPKGYTGTGYLVAKTAGDMYKDPLITDMPCRSGEEFIYKIWVENPGEYAVHIRNIHHEKDGDNDVWFGINRSRMYKVWDHHVDRFTWSEFDWKTWNLHEGLNTLQLRQRSKGFGIDRIVVHKADQDSTVWGDPELDESPLLVSPTEDNPQEPQAPVALQVTDTDISYASLRWDPLPESEMVAWYEVYWGDKLMAKTTENAVVVTGLEENSVYPFTVKARNVYGNLSIASEVVQAKTKKFIQNDDTALINYTDTPPVIDGEIEELWDKQKYYPFQHIVEGQRDSVNDFNPGFRTMWDEENLYFFIEVPDDKVFPELSDDVESWETDGVRILIDPDHNAEVRFSYKDRQYSFIGEDKLREGIRREKYIVGTQAVLGDSVPAKRSWKKSPNGYVLEVALPWHTVGEEPACGNLIGMELMALDNDSGNQIETIMAWKNPSKEAGTSPMYFGSAKLVKAFVSGSKDGWLPPQVWKEENGIVVVEAEDIEHHENWVLMKEPKGFTGEGYLEWQGPSRTETFDGRGGNDDYSDERQGPQEEWLIVRVLCEQPGPYRVNARNHHVKEDGDNDAWVWKVGKKITTEDPVRRMGDSLKDKSKFSWLDWGVRRFWLKKGVNNIYIGGRSVGFGIDRIAIYQDGNEKAEKKALKKSRKPSKVIKLSE